MSGYVLPRWVAVPHPLPLVWQHARAESKANLRVIMHGRSISFPLLIIVALTFVGCDRGNSTFLEPGGERLTRAPTGAQNSRVFDGRDSLRTGAGGPTATKDNFTLVTKNVGILSDGGGVIEVPTGLDPTTALVERATESPGPALLSPAGDPVRWGSFRSVAGAIIVKCTKQGTRSTVHLSDLVPKGTYSLWIDVFEAGTSSRIGRFEYTETDEKGKSEGNVFRASGRGEGHRSGFSPPRTLIANGKTVEISTCMLDDVKNDVYDWRVVGAYKNPIGSTIEQIGFLFETDQRIEKPL